MVGFVQALAPSAGRRGITVNGIAPGFIETRLTAAIPAATREAGRRLSALAQGGQPEDVAEAVTFFSGPGAWGVSGQILRVCGGAPHRGLTRLDARDPPRPLPPRRAHRSRRDGRGLACGPRLAGPPGRRQGAHQGPPRRRRPRGRLPRGARDDRRARPPRHHPPPRPRPDLRRLGARGRGAAARRRPVAGHGARHRWLPEGTAPTSPTGPPSRPCSGTCCGRWPTPMHAASRIEISSRPTSSSRAPATSGPGSSSPTSASPRRPTDPGTDRSPVPPPTWRPSSSAGPGATWARGPTSTPLAASCGPW